MIGERARIAELPQIAIPTVMSADNGGTSPSRLASHAPGINQASMRQHDCRPCLRRRLLLRETTIDEVAELFTEDCVVDYGPAFAPPVRGRAALRKMFGHPGGGFAATSHHNANVLVTFEDDDRASVRTSLYAWHKMADGTTPELWGYYHDVVVRGSGGWQIATRQLRVLGVADWDIEWHWANRPPEP